MLGFDCVIFTFDFGFFGSLIFGFLALPHKQLYMPFYVLRGTSHHSIISPSYIHAFAYPTRGAHREYFRLTHNPYPSPFILACGVHTTV